MSQQTLFEELSAIHSERSAAATARGAQAFARLLGQAEHNSSGQARRIAQFIAATYDGETYAFDLFELRAVDITISDDMLACLDALRWAPMDLHRLVPNGASRINRMIRQWGMVPGEAA